MHSPELGDYIGGESCVDLKPDIPSRSNDAAGMNRRRWRDVAEKKYPPPIQLQCVMKKYSMSDGRLVIKKEKLKPHQYLEAHRSNGRLILNLVPLDDEKLNCPENMSISDEEETNGGDGVLNIDPTVEEVISHECNRYNEIGVSPCGGFEVPVAVAAFRPPVHT